MQDAAAYFAFASDPLVTRYLRWGPHASLQDTADYLAGVIESYQEGSDALWGIELVQDQRLIGSIHLMDIDPCNLKADVGVVLHSRYWGRGFGSEALQRVLALCFMDLFLQRVQGLVVIGNIPACRMMEKCGMAHEDVLRQYALQKGKWLDFNLYSIQRDKFRQDWTYP